LGVLHCRAMRWWRIVFAVILAASVGCNNHAAQEEKCAEAARVAVKKSIVENPVVKGTIVDLKSYFDISRNVCIVHVEYQTTLVKGPSWVKSISVFAIEEDDTKQTYGAYSEIHYEGSFLPKGVEVATCEVGERKCANASEFNELLRPYVGK
jgi:hypothetical protein